jgi:hypothetical protein
MSCSAEVDADGFEGFEVELLNTDRRRLEDDLKLGVFEEAVRILAVAAVGWSARGLRVGDADGLGAEDSEEGVRRHGAGADLDVVGLLKDAALVGPELLKPEEEFLKGERGFLFGDCSHASVHTFQLTECFHSNSAMLIDTVGEGSDGAAPVVDGALRAAGAGEGVVGGEEGGELRPL